MYSTSKKVSVRQKALYILFAILATFMLMGGPTVSTAFAGCSNNTGSSCT